jgi:hypothetical protein
MVSCLSERPSDRRGGGARLRKMRAKTSRVVHDPAPLTLYQDAPAFTGRHRCDHPGRRPSTFTVRQVGSMCRFHSQ